MATPPPASQAQISRGVAWAGAAQAIIAIADLVSQALVLALFVSFTDYGIAGLALAFYYVLDTAADLGVTSAVIQRDDHTPEKLSTVFWFNVLLSGGLFVVLLGLGPLYGHLVGYPIVGWLLIAYGGKLLFQNVYAIPFALLKKDLRFDEIAKARTLAHVCESIARVAFAAAGATIWCFTLAALVRVVVFGVFIQARHPFLPRWVFRPREVIDYIKFGVRSGTSQILYQLYVNLDYAVVGAYFGAKAVGAYKLAYEIVLEPVRSITNVVSDVAFPTFARLRHEPARLAAQLTRFIRLNFTTVLPFLVVIALLADSLVLVFSHHQTPEDLVLAADCCRILCFVGIVRAVGFLGPPLLDGIGHPERTLRYMVFSALWMPAAFALGASVLGGELGARAVAIAWAVGYPLAFALLVYLVRRSIGLRLTEVARACAGVIACSLAGLAVGLGARVLTADLPTAARLAIVGGAAAVTIVGLLVGWQGMRWSAIKASMRNDAAP
ncbi:MAG: oligosaccharide flippase family protein [Kofleriaceae bacterium]